MLAAGICSQISAQNLTQTNAFLPDPAFYPQYMANGTATRLPVVFRATLTNLTANSTYRYYAQVGTNSDIGAANSGAGNPMLINSSGTTYTYTTSPSLTSAGNYETFTTDANGNYTGWFGFVNTGNARFNVGATVFPTITFSNGASGIIRWAPPAGSGTIQCLGFSTSAGGNNGTGIRGTNSSAIAKNFVVLHDNTTGTGRPLAVTYVESEGTSVASVAGYYGTAGTGPVDGILGAWGTIVPNTLANGVRRIAQYDNAGALVGGNIDLDGVWPSGVSTVNPVGGTTTVLDLRNGDAVLSPIMVSYIGNGNTGGTVPTDNTIYLGGGTATVLGNTGGLTRTGYTFANWNTLADGSGTAYTPAATFTIATNTSLYAQWSSNSYTLTYTAGANGTISGASSQTVNFGANGTAVTAVPDPGYQFVNWSDASTANPRTDINVTANVSVTANFALAATAPTVTTPTSTGITSTGATLGGNVTSDGGATIAERGVVYSITSVNGNPAIGGTGVTKVTSAGTTGIFTTVAASLTPSSNYSFKAYAINAVGTNYTTVATFSTPASVTFLGVASGDVSSTDAIVWTRATDDTQPGAAINVTLQYSTDNTFTTGVSNVIVTTTSAGAGDNTAKQLISGLNPGTRYYYRFVGSGGELSNAGTFKTAPAVGDAAPLHFAFSGDMDGLMRPYALASTVPAQNLDFYLNCGDVIYENASAVLGNNGASWLNSPSVTLSGSSASLNGAPNGTNAATSLQLFNDYNKKYREQFLPVNTSGQSCLKDFYAGQGNYTLSDNHELGNRQYINGGAPAGGSVGGPSSTDMATGRGVDSRGSTPGSNTNDAADVISPLGGYMNTAQGYQTLQQVFLNYQPIKESRTTATVSGDPRTGTTKQLFFSQQWGKNALYIHTDTRSYRDIRMKTSNGGADDCGPRADNTNRTYLGATQLAWLKQQLLNAEASGTTWKFVALSDPIDQIGPISQTSGTATLTNSISGVNSDGGKSYIGGYRAERNALLKFIADNGIKNVVFLATDDHQNRINEVLYATNGITGPGSPGAGTQAQIQAGYAKVPYCISIVCGPLGATGPETILNHSFTNVQAMANDLAAKQTALGIEPIGLVGYPGLHDVTRDSNGVLVAETTIQAVDFYSPDTFNYNVLDVSADGRTLTVISKGINATPQNAALEYGVGGTNTVRTLFSFQIDAPVAVATAAAPLAGGTTTGAGVYTNGASVTVTATANPGYAFVNWTVSGAEVSTSASYNFTASTNRALVANFTPTYIVSYNGNGNTVGVAPVDANNPYTNSATVTVLGQGSLNRTGYTFSGWNTTANGSGTTYAPAATFAIAADTTLYAQWTINTYTLAYGAGANAAGTNGPSTGQTPYVMSVNPNVEVRSLLSVGDSIGGYRMVGIPDGLGAFDNGDGTFTLLLNHELGNGVGITRAHGAKGAFVSKWIINKSTLSVVSGSDLMQQVYLWNTNAQASSNTPSAFAFNRFCSGDLPAVTAYYNPASGLGTQERIYMHGEEGGATGYQLASVVTGPDAGKSYVLGKFNLAQNGSGLTGVGAWENALANPYPQNKTIVIGNNDGGTAFMNNSVSIYIGNKQSTGSEVEKAGLMNGVLKFIAVSGYADASGTTTEEFTNTTTRSNVIPQGAAFTLSTNTATTFSRPEDGAWNPLNPAQYYFVTTDRLDTTNDLVGVQIGQTRLWRLTFSDITNPDAGGIIECLIDGQIVAGQKVNMFDNLTVNHTTGHILLQEDVGNAAHNGKVWEFDPATFTGTVNSGTLVQVAKHDPARFGDIGLAATSPFNQDEETSGIMDVSSILGVGAYLLVDQAHYPIDSGAGHNAQGFSNPDELVEGGQLLLLRTGLGGSVSGNVAQTVNYGADGTTVTANAPVGYHFVQWSDGSTSNPRTDTGLTSNVNVRAIFAPNTYTLTYAAGANGSLTGATSQTVNYGADGSAVTALPDVGSVFLSWSDSSTANPRIDTSVTANINVTASFAPLPTLNINSAGANQLQLSWPGIYSNYTLQSNSVSLLSPADWSDVAGVSNNAITVPVDGTMTNVFFRLIHH